MSPAETALGTPGGLAEAVDLAEEGILITDVNGTITYANAAFARRSGYLLSELLGQNPRILKSGVHTRAFYERMWARLTAGRSFSGVLVNRRKDGELVREATIISPYRDTQGRLVGYVAIKRAIGDGGAGRELARERADRAAVADALQSLQPGGDVIDTAARVCERIVAIRKLRLAAVIAFDDDGATPLAVHFADGLRRRIVRRLPADAATELREATLDGPWVRALDPSDQRTLTRMARDAGVTILGAAPIRTNGHLPGVLVLAASGEGPQTVERLLAPVAEFGALASALLAAGLDQRAAVQSERHRLRRIIRNSAFESVFQPIVRLADGHVVGHELLTRFSDAVGPQERFMTAHRVGFGRELETATIRRGLVAARALPSDTWLSINVGPELLRDARTVANLFERAACPIVVEITEHEAITEYDIVRSAVDRLAPGAVLAVDDAGAGYASLRHILELRPTYVKIDAGIVRNVDADPARQALIAGLSYFAKQVACALIAEGVETDQERETLLGLGIALGQGYLFGRPRAVT